MAEHSTTAAAAGPRPSHVGVGMLAIAAAIYGASRRIVSSGAFPLHTDILGAAVAVHLALVLRPILLTGERLRLRIGMRWGPTSPWPQSGRCAATSPPARTTTCSA